MDRGQLAIKQQSTKCSISFNDEAADLKPILRTVKNARNLYHFRLDLIHDDVGQWRECKLAPSRHASAGSSQVGEILETAAFFIDRAGNAAGRFRGCPVQSIRRCALNPRLPESTTEPASAPQEPFKLLADLLLGKIFAAL